MPGELKHFGIKGQKWGVRRFQNEDGTLTDAGRRRYGELGISEDGTVKPIDKKKRQLYEKDSYKIDRTAAKMKGRADYHIGLKRIGGIVAGGAIGSYLGASAASIGQRIALKRGDVELASFITKNAVNIANGAGVIGNIAGLLSAKKVSELYTYNRNSKIEYSRNVKQKRNSGMKKEFERQRR